MASGRRRHSARPSRRRWWYAWTAAVAAAVAVLVVYGLWPPSGSGPGTGRTHDAERQVAAALQHSGTPTGPAKPSPSHSASASAETTATASPSGSASASPSPSGTSGASGAAPKRTAKPPSGGGSHTGPSAAPAGKRLVTVVNRTPQTVWAVVTNTAVYPAGHKLAPGQSMSVAVPGNWGGRIWGRTGCATTAASHCASGDCTTVCDGPNPPTTLGEFTFAAYAGMDFYDVSMVDGSNLPMYVNVSHTATKDPVSASGCYRGVCTTDVACPAAMRSTAGGQVVGCKPPCAAFGGDTYCCRGAWAGREHCVPANWPVDYTQVFKRAAPYAYSYAFDDSATMACKGACYYKVTFGTTAGT
ncbi:thaumatin family protein [Streptomyces sp. CA-111067]|uniref:thaumatin family protein n=1 Tax=Streptomyces sp. CA-111067 TaxID=3240046 RepID=UPI003D978D9E